MGNEVFLPKVTPEGQCCRTCGSARRKRLTVPPQGSDSGQCPPAPSIRGHHQHLTRTERRNPRRCPAWRGLHLTCSAPQEPGACPCSRHTELPAVPRVLHLPTQRRISQQRPPRTPETAAHTELTTAPPPPQTLPGAPQTQPEEAEPTKGEDHTFSYLERTDLTIL